MLIKLHINVDLHCNIAANSNTDILVIPPTTNTCDINDIVNKFKVLLKVEDDYYSSFEVLPLDYDSGGLIIQRLVMDYSEELSYLYYGDMFIDISRDNRDLPLISIVNIINEYKGGTDLLFIL